MKMLQTKISVSSPEAPLADLHGYCRAGVPAQAQLRQRARVRTVFTDAQMRQLEALFDLTDYPPAEARAEVAKSSGLSEETVRVGRAYVTRDVKQASGHVCPCCEGLANVRVT